MSRILWNLRESRELDATTWQTFKQRAIETGNSPTAALARLMRRYVARGFDDGEPEQSQPPTNQREA